VSSIVTFLADRDEASTIDTTEAAQANFVGLDEESITLATTEDAQADFVGVELKQ
jgi:hypothetical protein